MYSGEYFEKDVKWWYKYQMFLIHLILKHPLIKSPWVCSLSLTVTTKNLNGNVLLFFLLLKHGLALVSGYIVVCSLLAVWIFSSLSTSRIHYHPKASTTIFLIQCSCDILIHYVFCSAILTFFIANIKTYLLPLCVWCIFNIEVQNSANINSG